MKHIVAPRIQHQVTEAGPPRVKGVLNVVAILEHRPMILNAKLICRDISQKLIHRILYTHRSDVGELALEGRDITNLEELVVVVEGVVAAGSDGAGICLGILLGRGG